MAAYNGFNDFVEQVLLAKHDFSAAGHTFKVYLTAAAPATTHAIKAEIAEIAAGNGYPAGGLDVQNALSETGGTATVVGSDVVFTAAGGAMPAFRYVVLYNDTQTTPAKPLVSWWDYATPLTLLDTETFTVDFGASILTLAAA